jgi:hypothetical protein
MTVFPQYMSVTGATRVAGGLVASLSPRDHNGVVDANSPLIKNFRREIIAQPPELLEP